MPRDVDRPLRIRFEHTIYPHWGRHTGYVRLAQHLDARKFHSVIHGASDSDADFPGWLTPFQPSLRRLIQRGGMPWYKLSDLNAELRAFLSCLRGGVDVIHFLDGEHSGQFLPQLLTLAGRYSERVVASFHQPPGKVSELLNSDLLRRLDQIVLVSPTQLPAFAEYVDAHRLHVILHGVDTEFFRPSDNPVENPQLRCITVGHWLRDWQVFRAVAAKAQDVLFEVVSGQGGLERLPNVRIHRGMSDEGLAELYRQCDVLFLPLLDATANNALLEGIASGLPVVSTDLESTRAYVSTEAGVFMPPNTVDGFVDALRALHDDVPLRLRMGMEARRRAEELAWSKLIGQYEALYQEAFNRPTVRTFASKLYSIAMCSNTTTPAIAALDEESKSLSFAQGEERHDAKICVSVILSTYNHLAYIRQALQGVIAQRTDFAFEILVCDDHSTDGTRDVLEEYQRSHPSLIRLLVSERNRCDNFLFMSAIKAAKGRYIALLDGDDWWIAPDKLQRQVQFLDSNPECVLCFHDVHVVYEGSDERRHRYVTANTAPFTGFTDIVRINYIPGCSPLLHRSAIENLPPWYIDAPIGDWPLYILASERGALGYIDEALGAYRRHSRGYWTSQSRVQHWQWYIQVFDQLIAHFERRHGDTLRDARNHWREVLAREWAAEGQRWKAVCEILRALREHPFASSAALRRRFRLLFELFGRQLSGRDHREFLEERVLSRARWFANLGRHRIAVALLRKALVDLPDSVKIEDDLAMLLAGTGETQAAADLLRAALARRPEMAPLHYRLARVLENSDLGGAIEAAQGACNLDPECHYFHTLLGTLLMRTGDIARAEAELRLALEKNPDDPHAQLQLSQALQRKGRVQEAIELARQVVRLAPDLGPAWTHLALLLEEAGTLDEAETAQRRALDLHPEDPVGHFRLGKLLMRRGAEADGLKSMRKATELAPGEAWMLSELGSLLADTEAGDEGEVVLKRALEIEPNVALHHYRLGRSRELRKDVLGALTHFRRATELNPKQAWLWSHLGWTLFQAGQLDEAQRALELALELESTSSLAQFRLAQVFERQDRLPAAMEAAWRAKELGFEQGGFWSHLGWTLIGAGNLESAERALRRATELEPDVALNQYRLAQALYRRKAFDDAVVAAERAAGLESAEKFRVLATSLRRRVHGQRARQPNVGTQNLSFVILGSQRTGSTVLGQAVAAAWHLEWLGEVFHDAPIGQQVHDIPYQANFFRFRRTLFEGDLSLSHPSEENQKLIFAEYKKWLDKINHKDFILDIKYNSWANLNTAFANLYDEPALSKFVKDSGWTVIHLVRENLFEMYCSLELAKQRNVWHLNADDETQIDRPSLKVDIAACREEMDHLRLTRGLFEKWFLEYPHFHSLTYEQLFCGASFSQIVEEVFSKVFGAPPIRPIEAPLKKVTPTVAMLVSNPEEVLGSFRRTCYSEMVSQALKSA